MAVDILQRGDPERAAAEGAMGIESFPEIENFQKLPHEVIIKGAGTRFIPSEGAELRGIVINNVGHPIKNVRAQLVVFDKDRVPLLGVSTPTDPDRLPQGGMAHFHFRLKDQKQEIKDYFLHANWSFDETA
ncbi:MAG: hypothetical protein KTQ49_04105 [Candidatus Omnitrophica bacterium]|nr:hypothetical protein [Candidatus Omnitrophota bacterium]